MRLPLASFALFLLVLPAGAQSGTWADAVEMGDRVWFTHEVEFDLPTAGTVDVVIRFKSVYRSTKDFFIDAVRIEPIDALSDGDRVVFEGNRVTSRPIPLDELPARQRVAP